MRSSEKKRTPHFNTRRISVFSIMATALRLDYIFIWSILFSRALQLHKKKGLLLEKTFVFGLGVHPSLQQVKKMSPLFKHFKSSLSYLANYCVVDYVTDRTTYIRLKFHYTYK